MLGLARLHPSKLRSVAFAFQTESGEAEAGPWRLSLKSVVSPIAPDEFPVRRGSRSTSRQADDCQGRGPEQRRVPGGRERFGGAHPVASAPFSGRPLASDGYNFFPLRERGRSRTATFRETGAAQSGVQRCTPTRLSATARVGASRLAGPRTHTRCVELGGVAARRSRG